MPHKERRCPIGNAEQHAHPVKKKRRYRDITERYCTRIGENVIVERRSDGGRDEFVCLSPHLCGCKCDNFKKIKK